MTVPNKFDVLVRYKANDEGVFDDAVMDMLNRVLTLAKEYPEIKATHCKHFTDERNGQSYLEIIVEDGETNEEKS